MPDYKDKSRYIFGTNIPNDQQQLAALRRRNNPNGERVGHFTGRCHHCGSNDLWDDNLAYGCNSCGAMLSSNY